MATNDTLGERLQTLVKHFHGYALEPDRAERYTRMLAAASSALAAVGPNNLFDTEPADLQALLESQPESGDKP